LPPYDQPIFPPDDVQQSVGFLSPSGEEDLRDAAVLRPSAEIDRFARQITVVSWRLRQFHLSPGRMDFVGDLRAHPNFKDIWLEHLRLIDGDLALGDKCIAAASEEEVRRCTSIAVERQIAAYWLQGDDPIYSQVNPATILMAC
jgi:hypothetical protein